jgi:hypothetical protein
MLIGIVQPFDLWLAYGIKYGWVSEPVCATHDEVPARIWEEMEIDAGLDPCIWVMRMWEDGKPDDGDEIQEPSPDVNREDS